MSSYCKYGLFVALITILSGCPYWRPNLFHPGPHVLQRSRAILNDPYADNDAGPEVDGGRPPSFENPNAEAVRNQPFAPVPRPVFPFQ